jgi:hypothetical protein
MLIPIFDFGRSKRFWIIHSKIKIGEGPPVSFSARPIARGPAHATRVASAAPSRQPPSFFPCHCRIPPTTVVASSTANAAAGETFLPPPSTPLSSVFSAAAPCQVCARSAVGARRVVASVAGPSVGRRRPGRHRRARASSAW